MKISETISPLSSILLKNHFKPCNSKLNSYNSLSNLMLLKNQSLSLVQ